MVRPGAVIAQRLGGVRTHEDGTGVTHALDPLLGIRYRKLQVLRRDAVGQLQCLLRSADANQGTALTQRGQDDLGTLHGRRQALDGGLDGGQMLVIPPDQDRLGIFVVLGLGEQVHRQPVRVGHAIADHQNLGRPGDHVDTDLTEHRTLGSRHVDVAGADDLVDARHGLGAIGQCRHGLGAADGEDTIDTRQVRRGQHQLIDHAVRRRHDHDDLAHARDMRRNRVHQHGRRIGRLAARHVDPGAVQRRDLLAQQAAVLVLEGPAFRLLMLVIDTHTLGSHGQRLALIRRQVGIGLGQTLGTDDQLGHARDIQAVEAVGELHQRRIAFLLDAREDVGDTMLNLGIGHALP